MKTTKTPNYKMNGATAEILHHKRSYINITKRKTRGMEERINQILDNSLDL